MLSRSAVFSDLRQGWTWYAPDTKYTVLSVFTSAMRGALGTKIAYRSAAVAELKPNVLRSALCLSLSLSPSLSLSLSLSVSVSVFVSISSNLCRPQLITIHMSLISPYGFTLNSFLPCLIPNYSNLHENRHISSRIHLNSDSMVLV